MSEPADRGSVNEPVRPDPVYLDYAATTPVDPRVAELMGRYLTVSGTFGNPGSVTHLFGARARDAVERARAQTAALINADPREIVWTSGATEANNLALRGALTAAATRAGRHLAGQHLITAKTEHKAVLDVCRELERDGCEVSYLDPSADGRVDVEAVAAALRPDTRLVSLMHVNNETGAVQDLAAVGRLTCAGGVLFHVDAAQSAGKLALDVDAFHIDLLSLCAHKIYGPKGVGALYLRRRPKVRLRPLLVGGGQEQGLRAGTLPVHQIVAMGEALRLAARERAADQARIRQLAERLWRGLGALGGVHLNGRPALDVDGGVPNILNISFDGVAGEALLLALQPALALSAGSACTSASQQPSHVLSALGLDPQRVDSALRFSIGRFTRADDIDIAVGAVARAVTRLRALSPLWPTPA